MNWLMKAVRQQVGNRPLRSVAEIGAGTPPRVWLSSCCDEPRTKVLLVEPIPDNVRQLQEAWGDRPNVTIVSQAVDSERRSVKMWWRPSVSPGGHTDVITVHDHDDPAWIELVVPACPLHEIDPGDLEVAMIDVEGAERHVLETMTSRPRLIAIECRSGDLKHPHVCGRLISQWMGGHGYELKGRHGLDNIYVRRGHR